MSFWIILSWVFVAILTAINVFVFLKLKGASDQMMKMAFPGAKDMNDALAQMQRMTNMARGKNRGPAPGGRTMPAGGNMDAQLRAAMEMLQKMQKR
jgi:hypothetical protein